MLELYSLFVNAQGGDYRRFEMPLTSLSLFDLDSTLYKGKKGYVIFDFPYFLYDRGRFSSRYIDELEDLMRRYKSGLLGRKEFALEVISVYYNGLKSQSTYEIEKEANQFWQEEPKNLWYPYTLELVTEMNIHTETILVSGSPFRVLQCMPIWDDFVAKYATSGEVSSDVYTGEARELATQDAKKRLIQDLSFDPDTSFAFGDSQSDTPLLEAVNPKNSFLFCSDEKSLREHDGQLYEVAKSKGWQILRYSENVMNIVKARVKEIFIGGSVQ
jgi:phosphoserine phosphatase